MPKPKSEGIEDDELCEYCINTMERKEIILLPYLNAKIADDILKKRPFYEWDDLLQVKGLGQKRVDMLQSLPYLSLSETDDLTFLFQNLSVNNNQPPIIINEDPPDFLYNNLHLSDRIVNQIIRLRPFEDWSDLQDQVSGIGRKTLRRLQRRVDPAIKISKSDEHCSVGSSTVLDFSFRDFPWLEPKSPPLDTSGLVLATWNIRHFSPKRDPPLAKIARIIERFDLVAIQEIRDPCVIQDLLHAHLPSNWSASISAEIKFGSREDFKFTEYYAFVYNMDKLRCEGKVKFESSTLWRDPFICNFSSGSFSFIACTVHLTWSGDRVEDLESLSEVITNLQSKSNNFVILGDFNTETLSDVPDDFFGLTPLLNPNFGTSTFSAMTPIGHLYDNICIPSKTHELFKESGIFCFDIEGFDRTREGRRQAKFSVSDHRPVWALFQLQKNESEVEPKENSEKPKSICCENSPRKMRQQKNASHSQNA